MNIQEDSVVLTIAMRADAGNLAAGIAKARAEIASLGVEAEATGAKVNTLGLAHDRFAAKSLEAGTAIDTLGLKAAGLSKEAEAAAGHSTNLEKSFGRVGAAATEAAGAGGLGHMMQALTGLSPEMLGFAAPVLAVGGALIVSTKNAAEFNDTIEKVANNTGMSKDQMESLRASVLRMGADTSLSLDQVAGGFEKAANAGFQGKQAYTIVEQAMRATVETGGDLGQIVDTVTGALKQFNLPAQDAGRVLGILMTAAAQGDVRLPDLAQNFSKVGELAGAMKLPLDQVAAAYSDITRFTHNAAVAQTDFQGMLQHILNVTPHVQTEIDALSKSSGVDLAGAFKKVQNGTMDLTTFLDKARAATHGNVQEINSLFGGIRGGQAALILLNQGWSDYNDIAGKTSKATTLVNDQWKRENENLSTQLGILGNRVHELSIGLGTDLLPQATKVTKELSDVAGQALHIGNELSFMNPVLEKSIGYFADLLIKFNPLSLSLKMISGGIDAVTGATHLAGVALGQFNPHVSQNTALEQRRSAAIKDLEARYSSLSPHEQKELDLLKQEEAQHQSIVPKINAHTEAINRQVMAYSKLSGAMGGVDALGIINGTATAPKSASGDSSSGSPQSLDLSKEIAAAQKQVQHWADVVAFDRNILHTDNTAHDEELQKARNKLVDLEVQESKLTSVTTTVHQSLAAAKVPLDALQEAQSRLSKLDSAAADEFFKTGSILPETQAKIKATNTEIAKFQKALAGAQPPADAMTAAQKRLQVATTAAYSDFDKYGHILPQHQQEIITDTQKIAAMQKAVGDLTGTIKDDAYQTELAAAQKKEQHAADVVALHDTAANRAAYADAKNKVAALTYSYDLATGATDQWTIKLNAAQAAATTATDEYLRDKDVLHLHGVVLDEARSKMVLANVALDKLQKDATAAGNALGGIPGAGKEHAIPGLPNQGITAGQSLAGGGQEPFGTPSTASANAAWLKAVFPDFATQISNAQAKLTRISDEVSQKMFDLKNHISDNLPSLSTLETEYGTAKDKLKDLESAANAAGVALGTIVKYAKPAGFSGLPAGALGNGGFGGETGGGGLTVGGIHFGIPTSAQATSIAANKVQAGYSSDEQSQQGVIDELKHQSTMIGLSTTLSADQKKIQQDQLQVQIDSHQTQIDQDKYLALVAAHADPAAIAAALATVTQDGNKSSEDTAQLGADTIQQSADQIQTAISQASALASAQQSVNQAYLQKMNDKGAQEVQGIQAATTAIQDQTSVIQALASVASAASSANISVIDGQTALLSAQGTAAIDAIKTQQTIDADIKSGDAKKLAQDRAIASAQAAVDQDSIEIARVTLAEDQAVGQQQIKIANDGLKLAQDKMQADAAAAKWQGTILTDQVNLDGAQLALAQDNQALQIAQLGELQKLNGTDPTQGPYATLLSKIYGDNQVANNFTSILGTDQTNANISGANWDQTLANDSQNQANDQASLASTQGDYGTQLAYLNQGKTQDDITLQALQAIQSNTATTASNTSNGGALVAAIKTVFDAISAMTQTGGIGAGNGGQGLTFADLLNAVGSAVSQGMSGGLGPVALTRNP